MKLFILSLLCLMLWGCEDASEQNIKEDKGITFVDDGYTISTKAIPEEKPTVTFVDDDYFKPIESLDEPSLLITNSSTCYMVSIIWQKRLLAAIPCDHFKELTEQELRDLAVITALLVHFNLVDLSEADYIGLVDRWIPKRYRVPYHTPKQFE